MKNTETISPATVMIVEDEEDLCFLLVKILKQNNLKADCAYSIGEAKQTIKKLNPDIVFIDNFLPDGYGSDFILNIREGYPKSKIIMI
ncbi:MAG: response regulator, partial [Bacteroidota bacterium]|nr:response regulator [Bacteroidota bacterium]